MDSLATASSTSVHFDHIAVPYLCLDERGAVNHCNAAAATLLQWDADHLQGKRLDHFLHTASHGSFAITLRQAFETGALQQVEVALTRTQSSQQEMLLQLTYDGTVCHVLLTDITPYKQAHLLLLNERTQQEQELKVSADRIRSLNSELEEVLLASQQQLHLLLARITNLLGQAQAAPTPSELDHHLKAAGLVGQQLNSLLGSLERYRQTRTMRVRLRPVSVQAVLKAALADLTPEMRHRQVAVTHDSLPTLQADSQALTIILEEYLSNALKFTRGQDQARIHVLHRETLTEHHIGVLDNGVGFNMRQKDRLFTLFGKLHSPREFEGLGVGLPTARRTCERFGARVWAKGKVNHGATFWFAWPKQPRVH